MPSKEADGTSKQVDVTQRITELVFDHMMNLIYFSPDFIRHIDFKGRYLVIFNILFNIIYIVRSYL